MEVADLGEEKNEKWDEIVLMIKPLNPYRLSLSLPAVPSLLRSIYSVSIHELFFLYWTYNSPMESCSFVLVLLLLGVLLFPSQYEQVTYKMGIIILWQWEELESEEENQECGME